MRDVSVNSARREDKSEAEATRNVSQLMLPLHRMLPDIPQFALGLREHRALMVLVPITVHHTRSHFVSGSCVRDSESLLEVASIYGRPPADTMRAGKHRQCAPQARYR